MWWLKKTETEFKVERRLSKRAVKDIEIIGQCENDCCSVAKSCLTLCNPKDCSTPGFPVHHQLLESTQTHVHWVSDAIQPSYPLLSPSLPALNLSQHQGLFPVSQFFSSGGHSIGVSASASVLPMNIQDWFPFGLTGCYFLAVQGTLKSLLQHHSSKASILRHSACFIVQLSHPYMTTGKTIALTRQTFVNKGMSLLINMLSRLVIDFLSRSKHLSFLWLYSHHLQWFWRTRKLSLFF